MEPKSLISFVHVILTSFRILTSNTKKTNLQASLGCCTYFMLPALWDWGLVDHPQLSCQGNKGVLKCDDVTLRREPNRWLAKSRVVLCQIFKPLGPLRLETRVTVTSAFGSIGCWSKKENGHHDFLTHDNSAINWCAKDSWHTAHLGRKFLPCEANTAVDTVTSVIVRQHSSG